MPTLAEHVRAQVAACCAAAGLSAPAFADPQIAAALAESFDPSEPRDEKGEWTSGGAAGRKRHPGGKGHPALAGFSSPRSAWTELRHGDGLTPRRLTVPGGPAGEREVEALPLDDTHSIARDRHTGELAVGRTAHLDARAARLSAEKGREAAREARWRARAEKVRKKIDPKLAAGVRQALSAAPVSADSLLFLLRNSGPRLSEFDAKDLLRRMTFVGDLVWSTSGGKTTYRLPGG